MRDTSDRPNRRGFASPNFSKERQREIARLGGKAAHAQGTAHEWTKEEARAAGAKGGARSVLRRRIARALKENA